MAELKDQKLFAEFPPVSTEEWEAVINKDLKGADYEKKLVWKTMEGFNVRPYYRAENLEGIKHLNSKPGEFPYVRGVKENNNWLTRQTIKVDCPKTANATALDVLMKGADSLCFVISNKEFSAEDLDTLLSGIEIKAVELNFDGCAVSHVAELFMEKVSASNMDPEDVQVSFNIDPIIKKLSLKGRFCHEGNCISEIKTLIEKWSKYKRVRFVTVNGNVFNNCGSSIVQELGYTLSVAHEYLVQLTEAGLSVDQAAKSIKFNFAISSNYFMEIAKFRAARMLWANIVKQYNPEKSCSCKMKAHAITSKYNMTVYDPYVNMLRGTTEAMSAAISGVSSIEVLPFDNAYEAPSEFSSRIARNVQLLLKEESHFNQVTDIAGGSYYIEVLTQSIAENAWNLFKEVENEGGYVAAFKAGFIQSKIEETSAKRDLNIATRREILLGTNQYPNFNETADKTITEETVTRGACKCCCGKEPEAGLKTLKPYRAGMAFEALRLRTDRSGKTPKAFMLTLGNLAFARARAQFSSNFFGCAGIKPIDNNLFHSVEEGVKAALESKAEIVVLCSSDDEYATFGPEVQAALGGKAILVIAGAPACKEELEAKGIKNFISVKSNVLETLTAYQKELGI